MCPSAPPVIRILASEEYFTILRNGSSALKSVLNIFCCFMSNVKSGTPLVSSPELIFGFESFLVCVLGGSVSGFGLFPQFISFSLSVDSDLELSRRLRRDVSEKVLSLRVGEEELSRRL